METLKKIGAFLLLSVGIFVLMFIYVIMVLWSKLRHRPLPNNFME